MRILTIILLFVAAPSFADDSRLAHWPNWRGPLDNGVAPLADPPIKWDANTNIRWKAPLEGRGSATPIVWGDRVFVLTAAPTDRTGERPQPDARFQKRTEASDKVYQFAVTCLDRSTGKQLWRKVAAERVPHEGHHQSHSYCGSSPTTDGKHLYVSFGSFGIYCYDFDGNLKWQRDLGPMNTRLGWGEAVTPALHGDSLVLNWDQEENSALVCLDARTGETRWKVPREETTTWSTPLIVQHGGVDQVIMNGTNRIRTYNLADGKLLWESGGMTKNPIPTPVVAGDVVFMMSGYQGTAARAIRLGGNGDVSDSSSVLWKHDRGTPYVPSPLLVNNQLWFTQANANLLTILDTKTGKPVIDRERLPGVNNFYASPASAAGRVYFVDRAGTTVVLKAGDKLDVLATKQARRPH